MCVFVAVFSTKKDKKTFCQAVISMWSNALWIQLVCFVSLCKCFLPI